MSMFDGWGSAEGFTSGISGLVSSVGSIAQDVAKTKAAFDSLKGKGAAIGPGFISPPVSYAPVAKAGGDASGLIMLGVIGLGVYLFTRRG